MKHLSEIPLAAQPIERFASLLAPEHLAEARRVAERTRGKLAARVIWNLNSTAVGGGVAEMLRPLLAYCRGAGVDARWLVVRGSEDFFAVTKRLHHALHGSEGDGSPLDGEARRVYERTLRGSALELSALVGPRDVVVLHDPQTAGLAPALARTGALVIWRCHIGHDAPNAEVTAGWKFLFPYLTELPALVFSRAAYFPPGLDHDRCAVIQPSIDAFSPKNQDMEQGTVRAILAHTGLVAGEPPAGASCVFERDDGTPERVLRRADVLRSGDAPSSQAPLIVQVSRWDPLKDPVGVMRGFAKLVNGSGPREAQLVLAGPSVEGVTDDPEGGQVFGQVQAAWRQMPDAVKSRIHLVSLPTDDVDENAAIVNALQRHASVIVQKSLHEGFGLTVTEAMWKARPVVASAVGGIQDQIEDERSGLLLRDPCDIDGFAVGLRRVLDDGGLAERLGRGARQRARERFLGVRHLLDYEQLLSRLENGGL